MKINKLELYDIIKEEVEKQLKEEEYAAFDIYKSLAVRN